MADVEPGQSEDVTTPEVDPSLISSDAEDYIEQKRANAAKAAGLVDAADDDAGADEAADEVDEPAGAVDEGQQDDTGQDDAADDAVARDAADAADVTPPVRKPKKGDTQARIDAAVRDQRQAEERERAAAAERDRIAQENQRLQAELAKATAPKPKTVDELRTEANDPEPLQDAIGTEGGPKNYEEWNRLHNRWSYREGRREELAAEQAAKAAAPADTATPTPKPDGDAGVIPEHRRAGVKAVLDSVTLERNKDAAAWDTLAKSSKSVSTPTMDLAIEELETTDPTLRGRIVRKLLEDEAESKRIASLPTHSAQIAAIQTMATSLGAANHGSSSTTEPTTRRVPVLRPSGGRSTVPTVPLAAERDADQYVTRKREVDRRQAATRRVARAR